MGWEPSYGLFGDLAELRERVDDVIEKRKPFAWDIETGYLGESREKASLHPEENILAGLSFTNSLHWGRYAPVGHVVGTSNLDEAAVAEIIYPMLVNLRDEQGNGLGVFHGGKFELRVMRRWFKRVLGEDLDYLDFSVRSDTMLESFAEGVNRHHGLKELTELEAERDETGFWHPQLQLYDLFPEKLTIQQRKCVRFTELNPQDPQVIRYACDDSIDTLAHHRIRYPRLQQMLAEDPNKGPGFIWKLEMSVLPVVCEMEDEGICYDWLAMSEWAVRGREFASRYMDEVREAFGKLRGEPLSPAFNFGSSQQLGRLLYEDCGMPVRHWTSGGKTGVKKPSTEAKVALKGLSKEHHEVAMYLNWKRLTKLYRDFLEKFEDMYCFAEDRRAHPSLLQHGVPAGRFAHADPNYAQSPKKYHYELSSGETFDFNFRNMISSPDGWYFLGFDLGQAELRAVAGMAGEQKLLEAFAAGVDVHCVTAALVYGIPVSEVTPEQRDVGKTLGFALVYGLTEDGLADRLGITRQEAEDLFAAFHAAYPAIKKWTEDTIRQARQTYEVETWWGRRVHVWGYDDADSAPYMSARRKRMDADRTSGNAPVQGSATGDYMKIAMVRADRALRRAGMKDRVRLCMNVHDALEWYVRDDVSPEEVIRVLQRAIVFPVPGWPEMTAEWHVGQRWGSVKKLDVRLAPDGIVLGVREADGSHAPDPEIDLEEEDEEDVTPARPAAPLPVLPVRPDAAGPGSPPATAGPDSGGVPRVVIITALHPVDRALVEELTGYVRAFPGLNTVRLRLENGQEGTMAGTFAITPDCQADISVILGGATVAYDAASVDLAALTAGVEVP